MQNSAINSMVERIKKERGERLEFIVVEDNEGNKNFLYLSILEKRYEEFQRVFESGKNFNPEDYGVVLFQGVGDKPELWVEPLLKVLYEDKWIS